MCFSRINGSIYIGRKRSVLSVLALVVCILFFAVSILSEAFIFTHLDHEHDHNGPHGGCATCAHMAAAENLLKSISTSLIGVALAIWCFSAVLAILQPVDFNTGFHALVLLKVRLNN